MDQANRVRPDLDWLGLQILGRILETTSASGAHGEMREVVDRLERTFEVLGLVSEQAAVLRYESRQASPHEAMQIAADLRRLANRAEAIGAAVIGLSEEVLGLEEQLLEEIDARFRAQSDPAGASGRTSGERLIRAA